MFLMDLSTVDGLEAARTVVQANDIIYVESNPQIVREPWRTCRHLAQMITTVSSLFLTYQVLSNQD